ncbi:MAG TPA: formate/nitrite transporter family protein [Pyrinomonadaceae bacterium]|jgi:formate/nitrite transporter FocA (FNT family)|nr:formate/nitrite transporter family protein [Pyrinomonadaceae bacterium]
MQEEQEQGQQKKQSEQKEAQERSAPSGKIVYKAILKEGEEELERSSSALAWSGLAAGLSMGFSMIAEGLLTAYLPDAHWRPLVAKFGYSAGFLIVILGRQQLFTENTLTPILPLLQKKPNASVGNVMRLWIIVLIANLIGAFVVAIVVAQTKAFEPEIQSAFAEIGHKALEPGFGTVLLRGIFAGWLIALMVWLLPFAETARVWVIILLTYLVGLGHFSHIIAGAVETFTVAAMGEASWGTVFGGFIVPALIGNILGGVTLVATLNHAQVVAGERGQDI